MTNLCWYPGHMTKAVRMMEEDLRLVDALIELADARIPVSSRNPDIDRLFKDKFRILIFNKADLADPKENEKIKEAISLIIKNIAPIKIAIFDVSPMLPGIVPTNISVRLGSSFTVPPLKMVPSGVAPL